jgi:hypothetical protein
MTNHHPLPDNPKIEPEEAEGVLQPYWFRMVFKRIPLYYSRLCHLKAGAPFYGLASLVWVIPSVNSFTASRLY